MTESGETLTQGNPDAGKPFARLDLTAAVLVGADLTDAYLVGADLTGADLFGADLTGAYLVGADLSDANLYRADLTGADLGDADLSDVCWLTDGPPIWPAGFDPPESAGWCR